MKIKPDQSTLDCESKYHVGQAVRLVPTQGVYQKEHQGTVTSVTATQVGIMRAGAHHEVRFRIEDGLPVKKSDRDFPCYAVRDALTAGGVISDGDVE